MSKSESSLAVEPYSCIQMLKDYKAVNLILSFNNVPDN
jgi:hypothetical protein